jgi:hypothetical protein
MELYYAFDTSTATRKFPALIREDPAMERSQEKVSQCPLRTDLRVIGALDRLLLSQAMQGTEAEHQIDSVDTDDRAFPE